MPALAWATIRVRPYKTVYFQRRTVNPGEAVQAAATLAGDSPRYPAGLRDLGQGLYAWLLPNGSWGESNCGLIVGRGQSLLVDTLWDLPLTRQMLHAFAPLTASAPITRLVNTHADGDHWWGNQLVPLVEIITSESAFEAMAHERPEQLGRLGRVIRVLNAAGRLPWPWQKQARLSGAYLARMLAPFDFSGIRPTPATTYFNGRLQLDIGGREVQLLELGPAHTPGDVVVYVPDAAAVFCGDMLFAGSTPVLWQGSASNWINALDRLLSLGPDTVVPGHGPPGDTAALRELRAYWLYLQFAARRCYNQGYPAITAARQIALSDEFQAGPFAGWDCPERIVLNVAGLYRQFADRPQPLTALERLRLLHYMALLAAELPNAPPAGLHPPA